jgi:hypothetical protein
MSTQLPAFQASILPHEYVVRFGLTLLRLHNVQADWTCSAWQSPATHLAAPRSALQQLRILYPAQPLPSTPGGKPVKTANGLERTQISFAGLANPPRVFRWSPPSGAVLCCMVLTFSDISGCTSFVTLFARLGMAPDEPALSAFQTRTPLLVVGSHAWNKPYNEAGDMVCGAQQQAAMLLLSP